VSPLPSPAAGQIARGSTGGIGLAAPQLGIPSRVFTIDRMTIDPPDADQRPGGSLVGDWVSRLFRRPGFHSYKWLPVDNAVTNPTGLTTPDTAPAAEAAAAVAAAAADTASMSAEAKAAADAKLESDALMDYATEYPYYLVLNPVVHAASAESLWVWEECLSVPGFVGQVRRPVAVRVSYTTRVARRLSSRYAPTRYTLLDVKQRTLIGSAAVVFMHEFDHLNGTLFVDHIRHPANWMTEAQYRANQYAASKAKSREAAVALWGAREGPATALPAAATAAAAGAAGGRAN
jgi:peptide deformylase